MLVIDIRWWQLRRVSLLNFWVAKLHVAWNSVQRCAVIQLTGNTDCDILLRIFFENFQRGCIQGVHLDNFQRCALSNIRGRKFPTPVSVRCLAGVVCWAVRNFCVYPPVGKTFCQVFFYCLKSWYVKRHWYSGQSFLFLDRKFCNFSSGKEAGLQTFLNILQILKLSPTPFKKSLQFRLYLFIYNKPHQRTNCT